MKLLTGEYCFRDQNYEKYDAFGILNNKKSEKKNNAHFLGLFFVVSFYYFASGVCSVTYKAFFFFARNVAFLRNRHFPNSNPVLFCFIVSSCCSIGKTNHNSPLRALKNLTAAPTTAVL